MKLLSSLLFAFIANMDNFTVGAAYGTKKVRINLVGNLVIAFITALGTLLPMIIGRSIHSYMSLTLNKFIGSAILAGIGVYFIIDYIKEKNKNSSDENKSDVLDYGDIMKDPIKADRDYSGNIDIREAMLLGTALAINNMGMGIGASISGLDIWRTSIFAFILSLIMFNLGYIMGNKIFSKVLGKYGSLISGILTILLGIYEFIF